MKKIIAFFKSYPELLTIPTALVIWVLSVFFLRWIDPTVGVFDPGIFQIPLFSIIQFLLFISITWLVLGLVFGTFKRYLKTNMKLDFKNISAWQRLKLSYSIFFLLLAVLAYLAKTLVSG